MGTRQLQGIRDEYGLTERQRAVVDAFLTDDEVRGNQTQAYRRFYTDTQSDRAARSNATRFFKRDNVQRAIDGERAKIAERREVTLESILDKLVEAYQIAKERGNAHAMVQASMAQAKLLGLEPAQRVENTNLNASIDLIAEKPDLDEIFRQLEESTTH